MNSNHRSRKTTLQNYEGQQWSINENVFLMENQDMPLDEQAAHLSRSTDEISQRRGTLGILRRVRAVMRQSN
jgi:exonuclease VII small subunit